MSFITTQIGQRVFLNAIIYYDTLRLHLYSNDRTPSKTDTIGQYTEVTFVGYSPKLLTASEWVIDIDDLTNNYVATFPQQIFTFDDIVTAYGYYITSGSNLVIAERFVNAPVSIQADGGNIKVTPTIGLR